VLISYYILSHPQIYSSIKKGLEVRKISDKSVEGRAKG
jgi:hypothetical protein